MKKLITIIFVVIALSGNFAFSEDNVLAVDQVKPKQELKIEADKAVPKEEPNKVIENLIVDESDKELKKIKEYREFVDSKEKELEVIKLDLEKNTLLLKQKEAQKQIYDIDKALPQSRKEDLMESSSMSELKQSSVDSSDIKILLLFLSEGRKEGIISLKGMPYSFEEGEVIASRLTVEKIHPDGITFKQLDGTVFKLKITN